jgi:hypothetical protein
MQTMPVRGGWLLDDANEGLGELFEEEPACRKRQVEASSCTPFVERP